MLYASLVVCLGEIHGSKIEGIRSLIQDGTNSRKFRLNIHKRTAHWRNIMDLSLRIAKAMGFSKNMTPQNGWFIINGKIIYWNGCFGGTPISGRHLILVSPVLQWNCTRYEPAPTVSPWAPACRFGPSPRCSKQVRLPSFAESTRNLGPARSPQERKDQWSEIRPCVPI